MVDTPKIGYMWFDGNPTNFPSFLHNFETCMGRNNDSDESKLILLIQHCHGKGKEAIKACVNLPVHEGHRVTEETLTENFGKPHIIARQDRRQNVNWARGCIFIYSCSARQTSFQIDEFEFDLKRNLSGRT